jgi:hypothetical protein
MNLMAELVRWKLVTTFKNYFRLTEYSYES